MYVFNLFFRKYTDWITVWIGAILLNDFSAKFVYSIIVLSIGGVLLICYHCFISWEVNHVAEVREASMGLLEFLSWTMNLHIFSLFYVDYRILAV